MSSSIISLPPELFFGNPQLPPDSNNHFIPLSLTQPTTIFAYALSTHLYLNECETMKQLVLNGGIEGSCDAERFMLDQNDNDVKLILDVEENGNPGKLVCKIFFATQFEAIRMVRDAANYELSLSVCKVQDVHGGKSGADFFITGDRRYLVKVISAREFEMFVTNAHSYFESVICFEVICRYLAKSFFHGLPSLLCKVLSLYGCSARPILHFSPT